MKKIKQIIENIYLAILLLFDKIQGAEDDLPVLAGLDAIFKIEDNVVGWATNVSFDEDFELQGIRTLGFHGDRGYKSQGYNCTVTIGTFVLQGNISDAVPTPTRETILTSGTLKMELIDLVTGETLYILQECKCATIGVNMDSGSLATKNTTWRCRKVIKKATS